jgi:3-hydroxybutyryl-CoA dehydrogenase
VSEQVAIAGSGAIACGLAATVAAQLGDVVLLARSQGSAEKAAEKAGALAGKLDADGAIRVSTEVSDLADATFVIEAIVEEPAAKAELLSALGEALAPNAVIATTTSSLRVEDLAEASGRPDRFVGLHVFNPVPRMKLVELAYANGASGDTRRRARALCHSLGKTAVEVPDTPGFVVNRLLFPYLFDAVRLIEETGLDPESVDECMTLGAGHPMGPLALLDFVGLDVASAIGDSIGAEVPARLRDLVADGALGRKAGRGFYTY